MIYVLHAFCIAGLLCVSQKLESRIGKGLLLCLAVILPCSLAAFRSIEVGTDMETYGYKMFVQAFNNDYMDYRLFNPTFAPGFNLYSWVSAHISYGNFNIFLFLMQIIAVVPATIAICAVGKNRAPAAAFVYYLALFPMTFNVIRQGIALSWVMLALALFMVLRSNMVSRCVSAIGCIVIAALFHTSAILGVLVLAFYALLEFKRDYQVVLGGIVIGSSLVLVFAYPFLVDALMKFHVPYARYLTNAGDGLFGTSIMTFVLIVAYPLMLVFAKHRDGYWSDGLKALCILAITGGVLYLFAMYSHALYRFALYFIFPSVAFIPALACCCSSGADGDQVVNRRALVISGIWSLVFFFLYYAVFGLHEVVPYQFAF